MESNIQQNNKIRYDWLDAIKALAMALVIFGHLGLNGVSFFQVYASFIKLPLFFAASGFVFNPKRTDNVKEFLLTRVKRIIVPYFCLAVIIAFINFAANGFSIDNWFELYIYPILYGTTMWFLPTLFICNIAMLFAFKFSKNNDSVIIITAVLSLICGYFAISETHIFMGANVALIAYPFCILGYYLKKYILKINKTMLTIIGIAGILAYLLIPVIYRLITGNFNFINMFDNLYTNYPVDMLASFTGVIGIFIIVQYIKIPKFVSWFGQNTLFYYAFHIPACSFILWILQNLISENLTKDYLTSSYLNSLIYSVITLITLILLFPVCKLTNKYLPAVVGLKKQPRK